MNKPKISIIAAIGENRELGKDNKLIWRISEDLKQFKRLTTGHVIIMGRKTYESIGRPLSDRTNIVITRNEKELLKRHPELVYPVRVSGSDIRSRNKFGMTTMGIVTASLNEALQRAKKLEQKEIFIIGGGQIFIEAIKKTDKLYLTLVKGSHEADVFFPDYSLFKKVIKKEEKEEKGQKFTFIELERQL